MKLSPKKLRSMQRQLRYLIKKELINQIPHNQVYNATDLINKLIELNKSVRTYSIVGYWLEIGRHEDYLKAQNDFQHISF